MDKITRMLLLYSKLIRGETINKITFCLEADCLPRTFDRDIQDIRIFLSETFYTNEVKFDRCNKEYYLSGVYRNDLEGMEYQFIERVLFDTGILRKDEMDALLLRLISNTDKVRQLTLLHNNVIGRYSEPAHNKALIKMHGDLVGIINNKAVIDIKSAINDGMEVVYQVLPCEIKYEKGNLYLIAFYIDVLDHPSQFRLDSIDSFTVVRNQYSSEKQHIEKYMLNKESGIKKVDDGKEIVIIVKCRKEFYPYLCEMYSVVKIITQKCDYIKVEFYALEESFIKWILSQSIYMINVIEPLDIKERIVNEAKKIMCLYEKGVE